MSQQQQCIIQDQPLKVLGLFHKRSLQTISFDEQKFLILYDSLCCTICRQLYNNPVYLRCSHRFCKQCIQKYIRFNQKKSCPNCRGDLNTKRDLRTDYNISTLIHYAFGDRNKFIQDMTLIENAQAIQLKRTNSRASNNNYLSNSGMIRSRSFIQQQQNHHQQQIMNQQMNQLSPSQLSQLEYIAQLQQQRNLIKKKVKMNQSNIITLDDQFPDTFSELINKQISSSPFSGLVKQQKLYTTLGKQTSLPILVKQPSKAGRKKKSVNINTNSSNVNNISYRSIQSSNKILDDLSRTQQISTNNRLDNNNQLSPNTIVNKYNNIQFNNYPNQNYNKLLTQQPQIKIKKKRGRKKHIPIIQVKSHSQQQQPLLNQSSNHQLINNPQLSKLQTQNHNITNNNYNNNNLINNHSISNNNISNTNNNEPNIQKRKLAYQNINNEQSYKLSQYQQSNQYKSSSFINNNNNLNNNYSNNNNSYKIDLLTNKQKSTVFNKSIQTQKNISQKQQITQKSISIINDQSQNINPSPQQSSNKFNHNLFDQQKKLLSQEFGQNYLLSLIKVPIIDFIIQIKLEKHPHCFLTPLIKCKSIQLSTKAKLHHIYTLLSKLLNLPINNICLYYANNNNKINNQKQKLYSSLSSIQKINPLAYNSHKQKSLGQINQQIWKTPTNIQVFDMKQLLSSLQDTRTNININNQYNTSNQSIKKLLFEQIHFQKDSKIIPPKKRGRGRIKKVQDNKQNTQINKQNHIFNRILYYQIINS